MYNIMRIALRPVKNDLAYMENLRYSNWSSLWRWQCSECWGSDFDNGVCGVVPFYQWTSAGGRRGLRAAGDNLMTTVGDLLPTPCHADLARFVVAFTVRHLLRYYAHDLHGAGSG